MSTFLFVPSSAFVRDVLAYGAGAAGSVDCFGRWATVERVSGSGVDVNGRPFVCFALAFGASSTVSGSVKAGELVRHAGLSLTADQALEIEALLSSVSIWRGVAGVLVALEVEGAGFRLHPYSVVTEAGALTPVPADCGSAFWLPGSGRLEF